MCAYIALRAVNEA